MRVMFFHLPLKSTSHFCKIYLVVPPESHDIYTDRIQFTHFAFSFLNMFHYLNILQEMLRTVQVPRVKISNNKLLLHTYMFTNQYSKQANE